MKSFTINHKNILQNKSNIVINKPKILNYALEIKNKYPEHIATIDKIALKIQYGINKNNLKEEHLLEYIHILKNLDLMCLDCYELINNLIVLAKHQNSITETKINWFGNINKTESISMFISNKQIDDYQEFKNIVNSTTDGMLKVNIGLVYNNSEIVKSAIKDFTQAKLQMKHKNKALKNFYNEIIQIAQDLADKIDKDENFQTIQFTKYLERLIVFI